MTKKMDYTFEQCGTVGVFRLGGNLTAEGEDDLKLLLMKAIHGSERAVLNLKNVRTIDARCRGLLNSAYCTSIRLKNPIILTDVPRDYAQELFRCHPGDASAEVSTFEGPDTAGSGGKGTPWDTKPLQKQ